MPTDTLQTPDFTKPRKDWRRIDVNGRAYYVPLGISRHPEGLWRVTVKNKQEYFRTLDGAWRNYVERRGKARKHREPAHHGPSKRIDTGVIGLQVGVEIRRSVVYVRILVAQSLKIGHRAVSVASCRVDEVNQKWLDDALALGAATRWHYLALREALGEVDRVTADMVPEHLIPDKPVLQVDLDEVFAWADEKVHERRIKRGDWKPVH